MNQYVEWINRFVLGNPKISQDIMIEIDRIIRIDYKNLLNNECN